MNILGNLYFNRLGCMVLYGGVMNTAEEYIRSPIQRWGEHSQTTYLFLYRIVSKYSLNIAVWCLSHF